MGRYRLDRHKHKLSVQVDISAVANHRSCLFVPSQSVAHVRVTDQCQSISCRQAKIIEAVNILPSPHELVFTVVANKPAGTDVGRRTFPAKDAFNSDEPLSDLVKYNYMFILPSSYQDKLVAKNESLELFIYINFYLRKIGVRCMNMQVNNECFV